MSILADQTVQPGVMGRRSAKNLDAGGELRVHGLAINGQEAYDGKFNIMSADKYVWDF